MLADVFDKVQNIWLPGIVQSLDQKAKDVLLLVISKEGFDASFNVNV